MPTFVKFIPPKKKNIQIVAPPIQCLAACKCAHHRVHHKFWMDNVAAASTLQCWPHTIRLSPAWSFEKNNLWGHPYTKNCIAECCDQWL